MAKGISMLALALALSAGHARAASGEACQPRDELSSCIGSDNLWPHAGGGRWLGIAPTETTPAGSASFALVTSYLHRPIGVRVASADPSGTVIYLVENALSATFLTSVGIAPRLHVSLAVPAVLYQRGAGKGELTGADDALARSAVGDLRFGAAVRLLARNEAADGPGLAARFELAAPTGQADAFVGAPSATFAPGVAFDWRLGRWAFGADVGGRIRDEARLAGAVLGPQLSFGLGASFDVLDDRWLSVGLETFWLATLMEQGRLVPDATTREPEIEPTDRRHVPAEWLLSVRTAGLLGGRLRAALAGGTLLPTSDTLPVTAPLFRVALAVQYVWQP
jgi:hypothetical protein